MIYSTKMLVVSSLSSSFSSRSSWLPILLILLLGCPVTVTALSTTTPHQVGWRNKPARAASTTAAATLGAATATATATALAATSSPTSSLGENYNAIFEQLTMVGDEGGGNGNDEEDEGAYEDNQYPYQYNDKYNLDHDYIDEMEEMTRRILLTPEEEEREASEGNDATMMITTNTLFTLLNYQYYKDHNDNDDYEYRDDTCSVEGATMIERLLTALEQRSDQQTSASATEYYAYTLHCGHYTIAVNAWSKSGHPQSAQKATAIVQRMKARTIPLNDVTYNSWMNAYVRQQKHNNQHQNSKTIPEDNKNSPSNTIEALQQIEKIMDEMEHEVHNKKSKVKEIRIKDYNVVILANARCGRAIAAEKIVKDIVERYTSGQSLVLPDLLSYTMVLDAWSKSTEKGRGIRAEQILDTIEAQETTIANPRSSSSTTTPSTTIDDTTLVAATYVSAMRAVVHSGEENIIDRVDTIHRRAIVRGIIPDTYMYSTLLDAYCYDRDHQQLSSTAAIVASLTKVEEILTSMDETLDGIGDDDDASGEDDPAGRTVVYNTALKLFKDSTHEDNGVKATGQALIQAEKLFQKMKDRGNVDEVSYGTMLALYANLHTKKSSDFSSLTARIEELMEEMNTSSTTTGNNSNNNLQTNTHHFNIIMNSLIRVGKLTKATELLIQMEDHYKNKNYSMKPNVISYSTLMNGYAKSNNPDKAKQTKIVFKRMKTMYEAGNHDARPNFVSYVTLVDSMVKSGRTDAAEQAESIVRTMYEEYTVGSSTTSGRGSDGVKPNAQLISTVIECWSKSGHTDAGERAENVLNWMIDIYQHSNNDPTLRPMAFPFASAISAWAKSRKFGKAKRAKAILDKMQSLYESGIILQPPNIYCYTAVINTCAYSVPDVIENRDSLAVFMEVYKDMLKNMDEDGTGANDDAKKRMVPNHITFSTVLTALRNLVPQDERRVAATKSVFEKCTGMGMCDIGVVRRLQSFLNPVQLQDFFGPERVSTEGIVDLTQIPPAWSRNVLATPHKKRRRHTNKISNNPNNNNHTNTTNRRKGSNRPSSKGKLK